jgi:two-component system chemotaxis sensor kinase CheA/two-component system sensor histidine kinase and response regulator WspE
MEEIRRRFLPRFAEAARERIARGSEIASSPQRGGQEALQLARELHSLAGEAGLLGFTSVIKLARTAEEAATELHAARSDIKATALTNALKELTTAIEFIERNES